MAWIKIPEEILDHPKTLRFMQLQKCDKVEAIGALVLFWVWCVRYAEDGDLRKHPYQTIGEGMGYRGRAAVDATRRLIGAGFIEIRPYCRVHDWWEHQSMFFKSKYRNQVEKWQKIEKKCSENGIVLDNSKTCVKHVLHNDKDVDKGRTDVRTDIKDVRTDGRKDGTALAAAPPVVAHGSPTTAETASETTTEENGMTPEMKAESEKLKKKLRARMSGTPEYGKWLKGGDYKPKPE